MPQSDPIPLPPANNPELPDPSPAEEPTPMLDVHPAHHAASTWRDFFIHIITIVLGLLIAVALEQTVELFHHRHQVADTREALRIERGQNRKRFAAETAEFRRQTSALQENLALLLFLQQHPGTSRQNLPGTFNWYSFGSSYYESAWKTAQQSNITALMPQAEIRESDALYNYLERIRAAHLEELAALYEAKQYTFRDSDPAHLTPSQIEREIGLTQQVLVRQGYKGLLMRNFAGQYPEFKPAPTTEELSQMEHDPNFANAKTLVDSYLQEVRTINAEQSAADNR